MRNLIVLALVVLSPLSSAGAEEDYSKASLSQLLIRTSARLSGRIEEIGVRPRVHCELQTEGGLNLNSTRRFFFNPLLVKLERNYHFSFSGNSTTVVRIRVSTDQHRVWVIGTIENPTLIGPSPFVISQLLTDELRIALGVHSPQGTSLQWKVQPIGTVQSELLDFCITNTEAGSSTFELAVLDTSGVQLFRHNGDTNRLDRLIGHAFTDSTQPWPRIVTGWLGRGPPNQLTATTSRGDSLVLNLTSQRVTVPRKIRVPIRQGAGDGSSTLWGKHQPGSPNIGGPLTTGSERPLPPSPRSLPPAFRDAHPLPSGSSWYWVTPGGNLHTGSPHESPSPLINEKVGDRILLADLDGDGQPELIHTRPSLPEQPDSLIVRSLPTATKESVVRFKTSLGGGSIIAIDVLHNRQNQRARIVVAEQTARNEHRMWVLETTR